MRVACQHCPRGCVLEENQRGYCFIRQNVGGRIVCSAYGRTTGLCVDPIEKKPLWHFLPGSKALSLGSIGCNLGCVFCQNWTISHARDDALLDVLATPTDVAHTALRYACESVAFTYNEPTTWSEYAIEIAKECKKLRVKCVAITSGYINPEPRKAFFATLDAVNIDLKGFSENFYEKYCLGRLAPVLDTIEWCAKETNVWLELTNLLIPRANDSNDDIRRMCAWIVEHVGQDVPLHFSAFYPKFKLVDRLPTPWKTLKSAHDIAKSEGLRFVYLGNVHAPAYEATWCPRCDQMVVGREGYRISHLALEAGRCGACGFRLPGVWESHEE
ncbi:MAG: AmmeMemoRadiSam system radical SAM enzyme [Planctomycetia bacterium]|nr:AmmeMemoRadiSam system radical SAM enzyme [Planctomycetia bacterium]